MSGPRDRSDAIVLRVDPIGRPPERIRLEPRSDGRWMYYDEQWNGCRWRVRGREIVEDIGLENGGEIVQAPRGDGSHVEVGP